MAKSTKRKCPACGQMKMFRADQKTCGCRGPHPNLSLPQEMNSQILHYKAKSQELEREVKKLLKDRGKFEELISDLKHAIPSMDPYPRAVLSESKSASKN